MPNSIRPVPERPIAPRPQGIPAIPVNPPGAPSTLSGLIAAPILASTPSAQFNAIAPSIEAGPLAVSGSPGLSPFAQPEGIPAGAPTDLSSLFGQGQGGLGPVDLGLPAAGPSVGMMPPEPVDLGQAGLGMPQGQGFMPQGLAPQAQVPFQAPQISASTTLGELVSRGLGGQQPAFQPQVPQVAAQPFGQVMPQAPAMAPQMAAGVGFPQAPGIAQPAAPIAAPAAPQGMASLFAPPAPVVQAPQQPYGQPAPQPAAPSYQLPLPAAAPVAAPAPAPAPLPAPVAQVPARPAAPAPAPAPVAPAPARQQPARRGAPLEIDPNAVNPQEDFPEALAARRANQRADGDTGNDPGRPYRTAPYESPDEPAPIEQPTEQPAEAPVEPELEPAFAGSPLQNTRPVPSSIENGELAVHGGSKLRFSKGNAVSPDLLARVGLTRAVLSQFVDRAVVGEMNVPDRPMDNADDVAALAYEYLRKQPQENFMLVILDGQGRPIQILRHQLGAISSASFVPHVLAGVAASTRGARTVYMVHNHPSTTTRFSSADVMAAQALSRVFEPIGLRFGGSLVVTDGDAHAGAMIPKYIFHPGGELVKHTPAAMSNNTEGDKQTDPRAVHNVIPFDDRPGESSMLPGEEGGLPTMAKIQVVERMFEVRKDALFPRISQPKEAVEQIPPLLGNLPGVAMLDKAGRLVGVIQMSIGEMRNVSSAGSIIYQEQGQARDYIRNEDDRAPGGQDVRTYKREDFGRDAREGSWNNPLAMLMAALERSNAESVIISIGPNDVSTSGNDTRTNAVTNLQKAIMRVGARKVEILDIINNKKNFNELVLSQHSGAAVYSSGDKTGGRMSTGERTGFNEPGAKYGAEGDPINKVMSIVPRDVVAEEGEIDLAEWWNGASEDERSMLREILQDKELMDSYEETVASMQSLPFMGKDGLTPKEQERLEYYKFTLALRDWFKSGGESIGSNEPGTGYNAGQAPKSLGDVVSQGMGVEEGVSNAGPDFQRDDGSYDQSGLQNAKPAEPIIKKTRKPRAKKPAGGPADLGVSDFPRTLDTTPGSFGRLSGEQMKKFGLSDAVLDQFIEHSLVTRISSGVDRVKTMDDAAHVVAGMRKRPQEMIVLLITDKTGKPIQIAQHQLGGPASAGFNPGILIGTAASTPGAAQVWFIHNHPSFKATLSPADIGAGNAVENLCKAADLKYMGTMAIAGSQYAIMDNSGQILGNQEIKPLPRKFTIPVTERMFSYHVAQSKKGLNDPADAAPVLLNTFGPDQPGIVLADNSNRPVAAIPLAADVLQAMRAYIPGTKQTGFSRFVAGVERSGGVNAFIYTAGIQGGERIKLIENVSKVCNSVKITALDAIDNNGVTHSRHIIGYSTDFKEPASGYNRGENAQENAAEGGNEAPGSIREIVEQGLSEPQKKKTRR